MKIINNQDTLLLDELLTIVNTESKLYISCNIFTAYAIFELKDIINTASEIKVLLNIEQNTENEFRFIQSSEEKRLNLELDRKYRIHKTIDILNTKIEVRKGSLANQNVIIIENKTNSTLFSLTPLELDSIGLGTLAAKTPILISKTEDVNNPYLQLFKNNWEHSSQVLNDRIIEHLKKGSKDFSAEEIYKYSIREIFHYSTISERADEKLQKVGFKDSKVWEMLYNFQKDAVIGAIEKIETYGGCIIADSVGLGKTFEALAVMKYYQLRNDRILVLTPKKLRENWTVYQLNDKRNILAEDRLNYDVLNHTDLSRKRGKSGDIDLAMINWGNYDLVVIDESHNFRNNPNKKEGITRYKRLMNEVIKSNIRTKVLMLSATPVNNRMNDLKNQISFITEGNDAAFKQYGIESIMQTMRDAQTRFTRWFKTGNPENLSVDTLMENLDGSYFKILDMLTIARSRKHIEKYYDTTEIGKFPERLTPITLTPKIDTKNQFEDIEKLYDKISTLTLAPYTPLSYVRSEKRELYEKKYDVETGKGGVFKQVDREQSLIYLMRINLLKRLESSIHSFQLTIENLIKKLDENLAQLEQQKSKYIKDIKITDIDLDDTLLEDLLVGGKTKVLIQDMDTIRWRQDLQNDKKLLIDLLSKIKLIDIERDAKLLKLKQIIEQKLENPINPGNKKVIIFSAFADTVDYLYKELKAWLKKDKKLYSALVTGAGKNKTNMPGTDTELNSILTHFSPQSKRRKEIFPDEKNEIDILFCTDCISEGQNLQDSDYLINYDIHWNPVRIIQRFGRIDRIGSTNTKIQLVNFFPSIELDNFIDLVARVQGKMVMLDVSATGEDNIIRKDSREMQDLDYRKRQLKQLQDQVIDLEDVKGTISITDMTFNDFKIDLEKSTDEQLQALNQIPPASYALVKSNLEQIKPGLLICLKDNKEENQYKLKNNILFPFFLVYLSMDGKERVKASQSKLALDYFRKLGMGNQEVFASLIELFNKETKGDKKMKKYSDILLRAIQEVIGVQDEAGLNSLATPGGTTLLSDQINKSENLELVSYLIIK